MSARKAPRLDTRRQRDFERELLERARAWIPDWGVEDDERDFGGALLRVAARFHAEVAERLDRAGEKMKNGLFDWLAFTGAAARPARMPVVFRLVATAPGPVLADTGTRMQVEVAGEPVVFETSEPVRLVPGQLTRMVGADPALDALFLPPPGLHDLEPQPTLPPQWRLKSFAAPQATLLQLDPALGIAPDAVLAIGGAQYRVVSVKEDLVGIDPPVPPGDGFAAGTVVDRVAAFRPFDGARDVQEHVLYLGHGDLLNIESSALIDVVGTASLGAGVTWEYWGKEGGTGDPRWVRLEDVSGPGHPRGDASIVLAKPAGAVEPVKAWRTQSRWIRARVAKAAGAAPVLSTDGLRLRINTPAAGAKPDPTEKMPIESPPLEVMVGSTPSPARDFFPLGREPRMFDALYLGSNEAFSKPGARARVRFDLAEPVFEAMACLPRTPAGPLLTGVDKAGTLHVLSAKADGTLVALHPPVRPETGAAQGTRLGARNVRPAMWAEGGDVLAAVCGGDKVFVWREHPGQPTQGAWEQSVDGPATIADASAPVEAVVALDDGAIGLIALRERALHWRGAGAGWETLEARVSNIPMTIAGIAPIVDEVNRAPTDRFVAMLDDGRVCRAAASAITLDPAGNTIDLVEILTDCRIDVLPFAMLRGNGSEEVVALADDSTEMRAWNSAGARPTAPIDAEFRPAEGTLIDGAVEIGRLTVYLRSRTASRDDFLLAWIPYHGDPRFEPLVFVTRTDPAMGTPSGPIVVAERAAFLPSVRQGEVLRVALTGERFPREAAAADFKSALAFRHPPPTFSGRETFAVDSVTRPREEFRLEPTAVPSPGVRELAGETFFWTQSLVETDSASQDLFVYDPTIANPPQGVVGAALDLLSLDVGDTTTQVGDLLRFDIGLADPFFASVIAIDLNRVATLDEDLPGPGNFTYFVPRKLRPRVVPSLELVQNNGNWDSALLDFGSVYFPGLTPVRQRPIAIEGRPGDRSKPLRIAFETEWSAPPAGTATFIVDGGVPGWSRAMGDTSSNPALSWEYWNGTGWWRLATIEETTSHLRNSGHVMFSVPDDLRESDWAGKKNYWIRARLIGGDYGKEKVELDSTVSGSTTKQVVTRTNDGIQPPYALNAWVLYDVEAAAWPQHVLTRDSATWRDQSDANRTPNAQVEVFAPLGFTLGRLSPRSARRALFLGFDATLAGQPVNVLLLADREADHDAFAPLQVEALVGDRFEPVVSQDASRGLGESGVLSLTFAVPATRAELFGETLSWLRVSPAGSADAAAWKPALRGAYLNAVWASATETLTRELLGSSEGAPELEFQLARPPLLHDSLDLRVREPLGEEEREALDAAGVTPVTEDANLPGLWVRWRRVVDPLDEGPRERVYALDEETGTVRFGDGRHGMIPPVGRDSIVAFSYQRTQDAAPGADVPANTLASRTALNLVTPVEGVEAVIAADHAAGGAPPEVPERVLRFGAARLRHRGRAITARDLEDLALGSSPRIAQARALLEGTGIRLVLVMRGADPSPDAGRRREVRRLLLESSMPGLAARGALQVAAPRLRRLRISLKLRVASLADSGGVGDGAVARLREWFDAAQGGPNGDGWPLGAAPQEDDVALALARIPGLDGIAAIGFEEIAADGSARPWTAPVRPGDLVVLGADPVRLEFEAQEALA